MAKSKVRQGRLVAEAGRAIEFHAVSHENLLRSQVMRVHVGTFQEMIRILESAISVGSFETIIQIEEAIQRAEYDKYSRNDKMRESIQQTQRDLADGFMDYKQLIENPKAYFSRGYRDRDRLGPNRTIPLDTMRKALRSQATRVGNFAKNPMLGREEQEFHRARVLMLRHAENLYESIQKNVLEKNPALQ